MRVVLVIEDDSVQRQAIAQLLLEAGYGVCETFTAELIPAIPQLDLVITDVILDRPADVTSVRQLTRRIAERVQAPVVVITARAEIFEARPAMLGAADVIAKPYESDDLLARVERAMNWEQAT